MVPPAGGRSSISRISPPTPVFTSTEPSSSLIQTRPATSTPQPIAIIHPNQSGEVGSVIGAARQSEINATARAGQVAAAQRVVAAPVISPPNTGTGGLRSSRGSRTQGAAEFLL